MHSHGPSLEVLYQITVSIPGSGYVHTANYSGPTVVFLVPVSMQCSFAPYRAFFGIVETTYGIKL